MSKEQSHSIPSPESTDVAPSSLSVDEIATAYHEAGHAVIAMVLGRVVDKVTIVRNSLRLGQVQMSKKRGRAKEDHLDTEIMILYAGVVSEARFTGQYNWQGADQDLRNIRRIIRFRVITERQQQRLEQRLLAKTEYLLDQHGHWKAVELIVRELSIHKSISGRAAREWFDQATRSQ